MHLMQLALAVVLFGNSPVTTQNDNQTKQMNVVVSGRTVQEWFNRAMDKSLVKTSREEAFLVLQKAGKPGAFALFEMLSASDDDTVDPNAPFHTRVIRGYVRWQAARMFGRMGTLGNASVPRLAQLMKSDKFSDVRMECATTIGLLGTADASVIKIIKEVLNSTDYCVWPGAVTALGKVRPLDSESLELLKRMSHADPNQVAPNAGDLAWNSIVGARMAAAEALIRR